MEIHKINKKQISTDKYTMAEAMKMEALNPMKKDIEQWCDENSTFFSQNAPYIRREYMTMRIALHTLLTKNS